MVFFSLSSLWFYQLLTFTLKWSNDNIFAYFVLFFCFLVILFFEVFWGFFYSLLFNFFYNNDDIVILKKNMSDQLHRRLPSPGRFFGKKHGKICLYVNFYTFFNSLHVLNIATFRISWFCLFVLLLLLLFCIIYH